MRKNKSLFFVVAMLIFGAGSIFIAACGPASLSEPTATQTKEIIQEPIPTETLKPTVIPSFTPTKESTPTATPLPMEITDNLGVDMMLVPAGEFTMGKDANDAFAEFDCQGRDEERYFCHLEQLEQSSPEQQVYLDAFYMDKYEVTNALYGDCVGAGICEPPKQTNSNSHQSYYGNPKFDNYPVIYVNWLMAHVYCNIWRNGNLPGEAQWEKAARGGLDGKNFPWGDEPPICVKGAKNGARFQGLGGDNGCIEKDTEAVGSYSPNGYGLYDMSGNVGEWVNDWYNAYPGSSFSNPHYGTTLRIERDGGWNRHDLRVWGRMPHSPNGYYYSLGFRCARDISP